MSSSSLLIFNSIPQSNCIQSSPSKPNNSIHSFRISSSPKTFEGRSFMKNNETPRSRTLLPRLMDAMDSFVNNYIDPPRRPSFDPKHVLSGNFAPVNELPPTECSITEGILHPCLDGVYIRNGPNPQYIPGGPHHLIEGDGMLHCLHISNGQATLCSRYVRTYKYNIELKAGSRVFPNFFSGFNGLPAMISRSAVAMARIFCGQFNPMNGIGLANTSIAFMWDKLFALGEPDLPYQIRVSHDGDIETIGRHDFDGKFSSMIRITAHPKVDAETGEVFAFRYSPLPPFLTYFRFDGEGSKQPDVPIYNMRSLTLIHDFAITKTYAIFVDIQIGMSANPIDIMVHGGSVMRVDPMKVPRIGVIPRYAKDESEMEWFDAPGFNNMHAINAWDEDDSIVLIAPNISPVQNTLENIELIHSSVEKVRINLRNGKVTRTIISNKNLELGVINSTFIGRKNKYGYAGIGNPLPKISGVVKLDWSSAEGGREVACRMFEDGCYGGEPFFVPKRHPSSNTQMQEEEEDDGYLVTYVHNENSGESSFLVMNTRSLNLDVVASVKLPRRVPYGFHGLFLRDTDLRKL